MVYGCFGHWTTTTVRTCSERTMVWWREEKEGNGRGETGASALLRCGDDEEALNRVSAVGVGTL